MPYIGNSPKNNVRDRFYYTATSGQTLFSGADIHGRTLAYQDGRYVDVYLNGVILQDTTDYTATTKTSVTLVSGATTGDLVEIVAYGIFSVADTVSAASGGQFNGTVDINGDLTVDTNTLVVDAANNRVGVGVAAPDVHLHVQNDTNPRFRVEDTTNNVKFDVLAQNSDVKMGNNSNHDLRIITNNSERLRVLAGGGLTFNGDTAAANALNDYEEGTFTHGISVASGSVSIRTGYQTGYYTKIGRVVHIQLRFEINSLSSPSGDVNITGLPFNSLGNPSSGNNSQVYPAVLRDFNKTNVGTTCVLMQQNSSQIRTAYINDSGSFGGIDGGDLQSDFQGTISITYMTS